MKVLVKTARAVLSMGMMTGVLLFSQQALAQGTDAGVVVSNQASVDYDVNGQDQTDILSTDANSAPGTGDPTTFVVDRRVDFTIVEIGGVQTDVEPGETDAFVAYRLTNNGNAVMDFFLSVEDLGVGELVFGNADTGDTMDNFRIRAANGGGASGVPVLGDDPFVDELGEGETVVIYVFADAGATLPNDAYDNFTLNATAADDPNAVATPNVLDPLLTEAAGVVDDPTVIDNVFANATGADADGNATEGANHGFHVNSAQLVITKAAAVFSDDFGSGRALPNSVIEYTVTLDNSAGASAADNVVMTDTIQIADVALELGAYGGAGQDVQIDGVSCTVDNPNTDDGCAYDATSGLLTVTIPSIAAGASSTVTYQVRISPL